ncbi:N-acetyltransferase [Aliidongia dinghuensis]|uniref:N-acetyltransferase n=1 Tax=Aliidongia dinghuensis TaxID=1867774 RepID=A0A8J2YTQ2_9PROT|nr:GNAT family N-acetyltransferase [Aliidongia dinghuensis]GGF20489.1 N-acetyltransferase [Aliidongia dinghuensis]
MRPSDSLNVDAFATRVDDIRDVELERLHALSISVGWPHRAEDWRFVLELGKGIVALDEIGRVIGSAMWFTHGADFATIGMVITLPRLQTNGTAQWLMQHALTELAGRDLRLNATRAARRLYRSLNFQPEKTVFQCQGTVRLTGDGLDTAVNGQVVPLERKDLPAVIASDAAAFGVQRDILAERLFEQSTGYGLFRDGVLAAFALCRPFGRGHVIGPVVAANDDDAIAVVRPHIAAHDGMFLRLDTHFSTGDFATLLSQSGLPVYDTVLTMSLGKRLADFVPSGPAPLVTYGLVSQTLG